MSTRQQSTNKGVFLFLFLFNRIKNITIKFESKVHFFVTSTALRPIIESAQLSISGQAPYRKSEESNFIGLSADGYEGFRVDDLISAIMIYIIHTQWFEAEERTDINLGGENESPLTESHRRSE